MVGVNFQIKLTSLITDSNCNAADARVDNRVDDISGK
jgi:hypothetical protein